MVADAGEAATSGSTGELLRVVVVDDVDELRALVRFALERSGRFAVVAEAATGVEAIAAAEAQQPDLVLLDVSMPVMDGLEALPHIREAAPDAVVVMLSGFSEARLGAATSNAGAAAYVEKGVSPIVLVDRLLEIVGQSG